MIKRGFTLAEVLITLSIIGVVAALTMPALLQNVGGAKIGPSLAKFVNTFESAVQKMMVEEEMTVISEHPSGNGSFGTKEKERLRKYYPMSKLGRSDVKIEIKIPSTKNVAETIKGDDKDAYVLKDGTVVLFRDYTNKTHVNYDCNWDYDDLEPYKGCIGSATVILNGLKGEHYFGRDVFVFYIDNNGSIIPYGSSVHREIEAVDDYPLETCDRNSTSLLKLYACTGAVADNGWKAPW